MYRIFWLIFSLFLVGCGDSNSSASNEGSDMVTVYKSTGAIQCESSGMSSEESAQFLMSNGVDVISSACGFETNLMVTTVCGGGTIDINLHEIRRSNLQDAESLEYFDVKALENNNTGSGYEVTKC